MKLLCDPKSDAATRIRLTMLAISLTLGSSPAIADRREDSERWVPSLSVGFAMTVQTVAGSVGSLDLGGGPPPRPSRDGRKLMLSANTGGTLEIMSPALWSHRHAPRIFFDGEILSIANQERRAAREDDPSGIKLPDSTGFTDVSIGGQGSTTLVDLENVSYGAGIGIAIPFEIGDLHFLIKPSARYLRRTYKFRGRVTRAFKPTVFSQLRELDLAGRKDVVVNAFGPSLELEFDALEIGDFRASVYASAGAFRIVGGNHTARFSTTGFETGANLPNPRQFQANWSANIDPWIYRGGIGFRLKWMGLPSGWLGQGGGSSTSRSSRSRN